MGKVHEAGKLTIRVYPNDHLPPHFHAVTPDEEALIEIATLAIIVGSLKGRTRKIVMTWAPANRDALTAEWNRINPHFPIG